MRVMVDRIFGLIRVFALVLLIFGALSLSAANAQLVVVKGEGAIGWTATGADGAYNTAYQACEAQWKNYMNNGYSRFLGAKPNANDWTTAACDWTRYQYLCPQETGAGFACGTILPTSAVFSCVIGYTPTADGHCRLNPAPERKLCVCDEDGKLNPSAGNPIVLSSGAKMLEATDYVSADGQFEVGRQYRSFQVGRPIDGKILPRDLPKGLIGGWNFSFGYEIQLGTFSGTPAAPNAKVAILAPDGTGYGFVLQASGQWIADPADGGANTSKDMKLEFLGTLPASLSAIPGAFSTTCRTSD